MGLKTKFKKKSGKMREIKYLKRGMQINNVDLNRSLNIT
jgi:hypothetical protein